MIEFETIITEKKKGIAKITLNRPQCLNAINQTMRREIRTALEELDQDDSVSVIILTGAGGNFSGGRDTKDLKAGEPIGKPQRSTLYTAIEDVGKPVIAAVNGICYTSALEMVLSCDLVIASEDATFADTHMRYNVVSWHDPLLLTLMFGSHRIKEIFFTCESMSARDAERIGFVNRVVPADKLEEAANELAQKIMRNSQSSLRTMKHILNEGMRLVLTNAFEMGNRESDEFARKRPRGQKYTDSWKA